MEKKNSPKTSGSSTTPTVQSPAQPPSETQSIKSFSAQHQSLYSGQPFNEKDSGSSVSIQLSDQQRSPSAQLSHESIGIQPQNLSHLSQKLFTDQFFINQNNLPQQPRRSISTASVPQQFNLPPFQTSTTTASAPSSLESDPSVAANFELFPSSHVIIRDPFAPDFPPTTSTQFSSLSPLNGHQHQLQPAMQPLQWDGKPPNDSKCMAELARLSAADPSLPPMVPLPNVKEGGIPHGGVFPQWSFFNISYQRQRLEQLYPEGTFPPAQLSRWSPMPMPMLRPVMPSARIILRNVGPGVQALPGMVPPFLAGRLPPGTIPMLVVPGPNGQFVSVPFNSVHPSIFGMSPASLTHGVSPAPGFMSHNQQMPTNNSGKQQCGANTTSITATISATGTTTKTKKETAKQRKQREREEQQRREMDAQQNQQTNFTTATGRSPTLDEGASHPGSSPFFGRQQIHQQMAAGVDGPLQGLQQDYCFKVPGRSPPLKRCTSSIPIPSGPGSVPPAPVGLTPMPDQRIHAQGQCFFCQTEINHQRKAIKCTAISQGCNQPFHWDCAGLSFDAFTEFCRDSRLEWICQTCFSSRSKECLMFAC